MQFPLYFYLTRCGVVKQQHQSNFWVLVSSCGYRIETEHLYLRKHVMFPHQIYKYLYSYFHSSDDFHIIQSVLSSNSFKWLQVLFRSYVTIIWPLFVVIDCGPLHDPNNRSVGFTVSRFIEPSSLQSLHRRECSKGVREEEGEWEGGEESEKRGVNLNEWEWVSGKGGGAG